MWGGGGIVDRSGGAAGGSGMGWGARGGGDASINVSTVCCEAVRAKKLLFNSEIFDKANRVNERGGAAVESGCL